MRSAPACASLLTDPDNELERLKLGSQAAGDKMKPATGPRWSGSLCPGRRSYLRVTVVAVLCTALTLVAYGASFASSATLTGTAVHITDHPAYVEAVVDFTGPGLTLNQVRATDANPSDGTGGVLVSYPNVASHLSPVTMHGLGVWVVEVPYGVSVGIGALPGAFKYLSYNLAGSDRLVIDVWKSTFAPAGDISRGRGGCLTLDGVNAAPGTVSASGTTRGLFENQFRVVLRNASGDVLSSRSVSAIGRWRVTLNYTAPQGQGGYFEAAASSAKDGALACLVQRTLALPASNARANLNVVYRAYADVNGDGRLDLVTLRRTGASKGELAVALAGGGHRLVATPSDATWLPGLVASGNVDGRPGEELFVDVTHVSTSESIGIYTYWRGSLMRAGTLPAYGNDYGVLYGITCGAQGARHLITDHSFYIRFGTHQWMRQDTVYAWQGPALKLLARDPAKRLRGTPSPALVGVQCGHIPVATLVAREIQPRGSFFGPLAASHVPAGAKATNVSLESSVLAGTWRRLPAAPSPTPSALAVSVWTGRQMVIFGRAYPKPPTGIDVAAAYTPASNTWRRLTPLKGPAGNFQGEYRAVWTGKEMLVLGPDDFQAYNPVSNRWRRPAAPPTGVDGAGLVLWTGKELIDWGGGCCGDAFSTGWGFNPVTNRWRKLPSSPLAPSQGPTGVWTGHELIVLVTGLDPDGKPYPSSYARIAAYNPVSNAWRRLAPLPAPRFNAEAVWDGREMLILGGLGASQGGKPGSPAQVGFGYSPKTNRWRQLAPIPTGRTNFPAVWTGTQLLIWGGSTPPSGIAFDPTANRWTGLPPGPLTGRTSLTAVWTGRAMILWGSAIVNQRYKVFTEGATFTPAVR
jgi:Immunoglobulin-like domain of bacterial spore germination